MILSSCASSSTVATPVDEGPAQPRVATYACADGSSLTIEALAGSIRVQASDGSVAELPASPPGQQNRFGTGPDAIVIEDGEALVMAGNHEPLACRR